MKTILRQQSKELTALKRQLKREIALRQTAEASLNASKQHYQEHLKKANLARLDKHRLSRRIILAQDEERKQISRTLYDEISQILAGVNIKLAALTQDGSLNKQSLKKKIVSLQQLVEKSVKIVHRFARELHSSLLDDLGLIHSLHAFMQTLMQESGLQIRFTAFAGVEKMSKAKRTAFYRVAQSALNNIAQHAKATLVEVKIRKIPRGMCLEIKDNGKAYPVERILLSKRYKWLGLINMRERVELFGGSFTVQSIPGKGNTIQACIPSGHDKD